MQNLRRGDARRRAFYPTRGAPADYAAFSKVRRVKAYPRRYLTKVNQLLFKNQIYADPADYDFVLSFIQAHIPNQR